MKDIIALCHNFYLSLALCLLDIFVLLERWLPLPYCKLFFSHPPTSPALTHTFHPPLPCVWERQCLHTMGVQGGCLGNRLALSHSGKKTALTVVNSSSYSSSAGTLFLKQPCIYWILTTQLPMTHTLTWCPPNTLKCLLFQTGDLGWRGWVALILEPGRMMVT